jgi:hypothetical protein
MLVERPPFNREPQRSWVMPLHGRGLNSSTTHLTLSRFSHVMELLYQPGVSLKRCSR